MVFRSLSKGGRFQKRLKAKVTMRFKCNIKGFIVYHKGLGEQLPSGDFCA